jgi:enterobacterial common antigen flippase
MIIGGSSALHILFRILQSKAAALLLGPQGVGLMGLFNSVSGLAATLTGMGISTSGVREIAGAVENDNQKELARIVWAFRRLTLILGSIGALTVFVLREWISQITFDSLDYGSSIGWLSIAVFFTVVSSSQTALIRGARRIGDLARVSVLGIAIGTLIGIPMIYWWGIKGVVFYILGVAGTTILVSWWYARKVQVSRLAVSWQDTFRASRGLLKLGLSFMSAGFSTLAAAYLIKIFVTRQLGVDATGLSEAASSLSNVYVGFILGAMGADFFPNLSGVSHDDHASNQLINAQAQIGMLLGVPGIMFVLALGPWLLQLLYSAEFTAAFEIFRWLALGTFLRLISWPLGFLVLARGQGKLYLVLELVSNIVLLGGTWLGIRQWGLTGVGIAFFVLYVFYTGLMTAVARRITGFAWARESRRLFNWTLPAVALGFALSFVEPVQLASTFGLGLTLLVGILSLKSLRILIGFDAFNTYVQRIRQKLSWKKA